MSKRATNKRATKTTGHGAWLDLTKRRLRFGDDGQVEAIANLEKHYNACYAKAKRCKEFHSEGVLCTCLDDYDPEIRRQVCSKLKMWDKVDSY